MNPADFLMQLKVETVKARYRVRSFLKKISTTREKDLAVLKCVKNVPKIDFKREPPALIILPNEFYEK